MTDTDVIPAAVRRPSAIKIHTAEDYEGMRRAGRVAAECLDMLTPYVKPGVVTDELDRLAREFTLDHGALPACLFSRRSSKYLCIPPWHVVGHGMPGSRPLRDGEIANIDVTVIVDGWHGDTSRMYLIGDVKRKALRLVDITYHAMMRGIAVVKPGATTGDIGHAIQSYAEGAEHCAVVRDFCGHGVGRVFHALPNIVHYGRQSHGLGLKPGMFFTVE